jgi:hypothetical protein
MLILLAQTVHLDHGVLMGHSDQSNLEFLLQSAQTGLTVQRDLTAR